MSITIIHPIVNICLIIGFFGSKLRFFIDRSIFKSLSIKSSPTSYAYSIAHLSMWSRKSNFAPAWISYIIMSRAASGSLFAFFTARCKGEYNLSSYRLTLAPHAIRYLTTSCDKLVQAQCNGVLPHLSFESIRNAEFLKKYASENTAFDWAATWSILRPCSFYWWTLAP